MSDKDDVIDRILSGEASAEEAADFQRWLAVPANLERFALRAELHADLRRSLLRRSIQTSALAANRVAVDSAPLPAKRSRYFTRSPKTLLRSIAVLATAACLFVMFKPGEDSGNPASVNAATVVSNVNGLLSKEGQQWEGAKLPAGGYELQQGLLNLRFGNNVMVYVEAPARFDAVSDQRVVLHRGRLSANVPPEGVGFTVETPEAEVVDFGTEFSVDVEGGSSEVHVFDGLVRVHPGASSQRDESNSLDLHASEAVRIANGVMKPVGISIATDRFIRSFDEPKRNYARAVKALSPLAYYRMPIRDRGLVCDPPEYSGVVLTGDGRRPPHARGVFVGGSLRVGADSSGRGGRIDSPPALNTGRFSLAVFVYLETPSGDGVVATNLHEHGGNFGLSLNERGQLQATIRSANGQLNSVAGGSVLPIETWRHVVMTADGEHVQIYEDGALVASQPCGALAVSDSDTAWFGTDASGSQTWNGRIDEPALFDRALSAEQVAALYHTAVQEISRLQ